MSGIALATPAEEAELEQLNKIEQELELQREWAKYRWGKASSECYQKYWVNSCLRDARADYRREIDPIRTQEVALHEVQRKLRESLKNQEDIYPIIYELDFYSFRFLFIDSLLTMTFSELIF